VIVVSGIEHLAKGFAIGALDGGLSGQLGIFDGFF
jgi:hypothetical protein